MRKMIRIGSGFVVVSAALVIGVFAETLPVNHLEKATVAASAIAAAAALVASVEKPGRVLFPVCVSSVSLCMALGCLAYLLR